jgi:hypothetical protein
MTVEEGRNNRAKSTSETGPITGPTVGPHYYHSSSSTPPPEGEEVVAATESVVSETADAVPTQRQPVALEGAATFAAPSETAQVDPATVKDRLQFIEDDLVELHGLAVLEPPALPWLAPDFVEADCDEAMLRERAPSEGAEALESAA